MGLKTFDRKFGSELLRELPAQPAVYLFKDAEGSVLYVGQSSNVRRRLRDYRNATRRKAHRKMRALVRDAASLEVRPQASARAALLLENELIRTLRPPRNIDGAYSFLYPALGTARHDDLVLIGWTTRVEAFAAVPFRWFGCFRSRERSRGAFDALERLLGWVGHPEPTGRLTWRPRVRGSRLRAFRRLGPWLPDLDRFLAGEDASLLPRLSEALLAKPDARRDAESVGLDLRELEAFWRSDVAPLRAAQTAISKRPGFVSQQERDALFIASRTPR
ncbi:MAG: nucleotide excision repair endonuclease [Myxococcales bacterium]|nr:nucleotide excision repair endonuclease [Myxococcales bacterium]